MISFRFHIVSIVAVFLALAIGIVIGSTVIDRAIVEGLRNRVDEVSDNLDQRQAENDRLRDRTEELGTFVTESAPYTVEDRLRGTVTVLVVDAGLDDQPVERTVELLGLARSRVRGILTLDSSWTLEDGEQAADVAEFVDLEADAPVEDLQARAAALLVSDLSSEVVPVDDETGPLGRVEALGLADYEALDVNVVVQRPRQVQFVIVSGPESDLGGSGHTEGFAVAAAESTGAAVVAEIWSEVEDGPDRADSLALFLGSPTLSAVIATVDNLDTAPGPTTVVLAADAARAGEIGHYGVGDGASSSVPPLTTSS